MPQRFDPRLDILPDAQRELWPQLSAAPRLSFVLYGGTAVALHLGHRQSVDFDFFRSDPLDKGELGRAFGFIATAAILQEGPDTLAVSVPMPSGPVEASFFGGIRAIASGVNAPAALSLSALSAGSSSTPPAKALRSTPPSNSAARAPGSAAA